MAGLTKEEQSLENANTLSAFEKAKRNYEAGNTAGANWIDPINGLLNYGDFLKRTAPGTGDMYSRVAERYASPQMSVQATPAAPKTGDQIQFESLYPGKTYVPPAGAASNVPAVPAPTTAADKSATRTATNTVKGYDTNNNWAEVWVPAGKYVPGVSATPKKVTTSSLEGATNTTIPGIETIGQNREIISQEANTEADRVLAEIENRKKIFEASKTELQKLDDSLLREQLANIAGVEGKSAYKAQLEQAKLDPIEKSIDDLNIELATLKNQKDTLLAEQRGKPITMSSIIGAQAQIEAVMNSKILGVAGMIDALNGNFLRAEKSIQRAVDAKYGPAEERNAIIKAQRDAIAPTLTKQEKVQLDALNAIQAKEVQALADKKDSEKEIYGLMLKAVDLGIRDASILSQIGNSKSLSEATVILGKNAPPADSKAPQIETWGGRVHQWNPVTAKWEDIGSEKSIGGDNSQTVIDWANQVANGTRKFSDVPEELKSSVNSAISKLPPKQEDVKQTQSKIDELNSIINHPGLNSSVGPNAASRTAFTDAFGNKSDFIAKVQRLLSEKTLQSLIDAKANGATFGALSEGELKLLQQAASNIGTWAVKDDEGNIIGYNVSEKAFKEEVNRIKSGYETLLKETAGQQTNTFNITQKIDDYYLKNPDKRAFIDTLDAEKNPATGQEYTEEEKAKILGISFNQVGGDTNIAAKVASVTPDGSVGGECGIYSRKLVDFPSGMGDKVEEKLAFVRKEGELASQWRKNPKVGDVLFFDSPPPYGHVAVVNALLPNGQVQLSESNWSERYKVDNTRKIALNDPNIYGAVRGKLKV